MTWLWAAARCRSWSKFSSFVSYSLVNAPGLYPGGAGRRTAHAGRPVPGAPGDGALPRGKSLLGPMGGRRISGLVWTVCLRYTALLCSSRAHCVLHVPGLRFDRPHLRPLAEGRFPLGPSAEAAFVGWLPGPYAPGARCASAISQTEAQRSGFGLERRSKGVEREIPVRGF